MRVTKAIKDFIVKEITNKYQPIYDDIGNEYRQLLDAYKEEIRALEIDTVEKAKAIAAKFGLQYHTNYRIAEVSRSALNPVVTDEISQRRHELYEKKEQMISDLLLDLELGETTKAELKAVLENVSFEN